MNEDVAIINFWKEQFEAFLKNHLFTDSSHDQAHFRRVWRLADSFCSGTEDRLVILAACYFHDIVSYPKNDSKRSQSSRDAAIRAAEILKNLNFPEEKISAVRHCIEAHSFSANIHPETPEAAIVQDADRMEALGAIGLARTFYVAGLNQSQIFNSEDPFSLKRELDDQKYAIDHFHVKLLKLPGLMKTAQGRAEAEKRTQFLKAFIEQLSLELGEPYSAPSA